ncbi:CDP-diacylglycerol--inositol 3-phosphatidyltransferase 1 isoform X4 [Cucumis melo]|nr:CDP-diacylglycerol--inositol 3-phosphatidyltransferase 1 isoform X4 [Cucumis melo]
MNIVAFALCFSNKIIFSVLYFVRWVVCSQIQSSFHVWGCAGHGNRQNLLYHRISTACLLVILSQVYRPGLTFVSLLALDIASHWLQMYSTFLIGKASHKDVKDSTNWLFKAYYGNRTFMAYCCVSCEVLYIILFLLAEKQNENLMDVILHSIQQKSFLSLLVVISLFGWAVKQAVNVIQMKTAADVCVLHDTNKKQKP